MIDTITLELTEGQYTIFERDKFLLTTSQKGVQRWVNNPKPDELKRKVYYPKLTEAERVNVGGRREKSLTIQVSLPKMFFGNNFDELCEADFDQVIAKLQECLGRRSVKVFDTHLRMARVIGIHYGNNIVYTDGTTPKMIIDKVAQGDYTRRWDVEWVKYRNNGLLWKLHTNTWELAIYDKKADLLQAKISEGRADEKDNYPQLKLFDESKHYKPFEVLRIEARLNKRTKLKQTFKEIGIDCPLTFDRLFSESITKRVLLYYLDMVERARPPFFDYKASCDDDLLADLSICNPNLSPTALLAIAYIKYRAERGGTVGDIRELVTNGADWQWRKLMRQVSEVAVSRRDLPFVSIRQAINNYKALKLKDYDELTLFE